MKDKIHIININTKYNTDLLPVHINDNEVIDERNSLRSQYSMEIVIHNLLKKYPNLSNYIESDIIYIPIYLFLSAWKQKYFYDVNEIIKNLNELKDLIEKCLLDNKKVLMVYSDVMWEDKRCFLNHFKFNENVFFVCYEDVENDNKQIPIPYCTHIESKNHTIPFHSDKKFLISYVGRSRNETSFFPNIEIINTEIKDNRWISINDLVLYNKIDDLYKDSYFSLQPHGDKKSRKGFYHSLLMGCIPVVFENNYNIYEKIFRDYIDIKDICIILDFNDIKNFNNILEQEKSNIEEKIKNIGKIKNLLLYDDISIIEYILRHIYK
jgi:hypothetical protein